MKESVQQHYDLGNETTRLEGPSLERLRTESILRRYLPKAPATVLDIGGADGVYAFSLATRGYNVHLVDPVELHIDQAIKKNESAQSPLQSIKTGDARKLDFESEFADAVLYFGPLYHLTEASDRGQALTEAFRVLKKGGVFISAHISQFTSFIDGVRGQFLEDPDFVKIVAEDLATGRHYNPSNHPAYFTEAIFQHPLQAKRETQLAGFCDIKLLSIEGPVWMIDGVGPQLANPETRQRILEFLERVEAEETLVGASSHYGIVAIKL